MSDIAKYGEIEVSASRNGHMWLDDAREQFARLLVTRIGLVAAYKQAINPDVTDEVALSLGATMARVAEVSERIQKLEEDRILIRNLSKDSITSDYLRMTRVTPDMYFDEEWNMLPKVLWSEDMRIACKSIERTRFGWKLDLYGKIEIMDKVSDMMGYNAPKQTEMRVVNDYKNMTDEELKQRAGIQDVDCEIMK